MERGDIKDGTYIVNDFFLIMGENVVFYGFNLDVPGAVEADVVWELE